MRQTLIIIALIIWHVVFYTVSIRYLWTHRERLDEKDWLSLKTWCRSRIAKMRAWVTAPRV